MGARIDENLFDYFPQGVDLRADIRYNPSIGTVLFVLASKGSEEERYYGGR